MILETILLDSETRRPGLPIYVPILTVGTWEYLNPQVPLIWTPIRTSGNWIYSDPQKPLTWTPIRTTGVWSYHDIVVWVDITTGGVWEYNDVALTWTDIPFPGENYWFDEKNQPWTPLPPKDRYFITSNFVNQIKINTVYQSGSDLRMYCTAVRDVDLTNGTLYVGDGKGGYQDEQLIPNGTTENWTTDLANPSYFDLTIVGKNGYVDLTGVNCSIKNGESFYISLAKNLPIPPTFDGYLLQIGDTIPKPNRWCEFTFNSDKSKITLNVLKDYSHTTTVAYVTDLNGARYTDVVDADTTYTTTGKGDLVVYKNGSYKFTSTGSFKQGDIITYTKK